MALKVLITAIDTTNTAKSFGIVGSVLLDKKDLDKNNRAANDDDAVLYSNSNLNSKKLVAVIDQLSIMDNLLKHKLENQKIAYRNNKLDEQEARIERNSGFEKYKDAEKIQSYRTSGLGMLGLLGLGILAYDPVLGAMKKLADFALEAGTFLSDTMKEITKFFEDFLPDDPEEVDGAPSVQPLPKPRSLREEAEGAPLRQPPPADAEPVSPPPKPPGPTLREQAESAGARRAKPKAEPAAPQTKDDRSWWERNAPSWAGGKDAPKAATPAAPEAKAATPPKNVTVQSGVNLNGVNSDLKNRLFKALAEYGEPITITSGLRTDKQQAELWVRGNIFKERGIYTPNRPSVDTTVVVRGKTFTVKGSGKKNSHLGGAGVDIAISQVRDKNKLDSILNKYGLGRNPNGQDPVHIYLLKGGATPVSAPAETAPVSKDASPASSSAASKTLVDKAEETVNNTLMSMAEFIGTIGGKVVGRGVARNLTSISPNFAKLISDEAAIQTAEIAKIKSDASKPTPPPVVSPPNINSSGSGAVQNVPTMVDRNSVEYYLSRFGYKETNSPIKASA